MLGYLDDPDATRTAIDEGGWLHTGDAGRLDAAGYLRITGRIKDMYICGGFNVYPAEVEQALARLDGVTESAVIGVPDPRLGEVGKAFLVTRPGQVLAEADVLAFCRERLANYKVPRRWNSATPCPQGVGQGPQATAQGGIPADAGWMSPAPRAGLTPARLAEIPRSVPPAAAVPAVSRCAAGARAVRGSGPRTRSPPTGRPE